MNKRTFAAGMFAAAASLIVGVAHASPLLTLGAASSFNTFVLGDMSHQHSDVEGALGVAGNAHLQDYAVGMLLDPSADHTDTLVVGGDIRFTSGRLYHGNLVYGGSANLSGVGLYAGEDPAQVGGTVRQDGNAVDFLAASKELKTLSARYAGYGINGASVFSPWGGEVQLIGSDPLLNVFTLDVAELANLRLDLVVPDGSWSVVNFTGDSVSLNHFGFQFGTTVLNDNVRHDGQLSGRTLFNFANATHLEIFGLALPGSVLAPYADVHFYNARIDGQLIAGGLYGAPGDGSTCLSDPSVCSGQTNWYPFLALNSVPTPGTLPLLALAICLMIGWRARGVRSGVARVVGSPRTAVRA